MPAFYWMKLYNDLLDDAKMQRLPDRLWRRAIELMLVASKTRRDTHEGRLPPVEQIAWHLRLPAEEVEADLVELANRTGVVENRGGRWYVTHFAERQAAATPREKMRAYRERKNQGQGLFDVPDAEEQPAASNEKWHIRLASALPKTAGAYRIVCRESGRQHIGASREVRARVLAQLRTISQPAGRHSLSRDFAEHGPDSFVVELLGQPQDDQRLVDVECDAFRRYGDEYDLVGTTTTSRARPPMDNMAWAGNYERDQRVTTGHTDIEEEEDAPTLAD